MPNSTFTKSIILFLIITMVIPWPVFGAEREGRLEKLKQIRQEKIETQELKQQAEESPEKVDLILPEEEGAPADNDSQKEQPDPPVLDRTFSPGGINVETDASSGAAVLSYPFALPPGRNNLTPQINLNYNSQNNNNHSNFYGLGWDLNLGYIERLNKKGTEKIYTQNYFSFSLAGNGGELINLNPGQTYGFYGNKIESSFNKFEFKSNNTWEVTDTTGTRYLFGKTSASRLDNPEDTSKIYRWYLAEIIDTNNNFIKYEYYKNSAQVYPKKITYTGHYNGATPTDGPFIVNFEPFASGSPAVRPDATSSFTPGFKVETKYSVEKIEVKINSQLRRRYQLDFKQSYLTSRSLLDSITETSWDKSGQTIALPPTTFKYTNEQAKAEIKDWQTDKWAFPRNSAIELDYAPWADFNGKLIDLNNDGYEDIKQFMADPKYKIWSFSTIMGTPPDFCWDCGRFVDINNDNYPDSVVASDLSGGQTQAIFLNNGSAFEQTSQWSLPTDVYFYSPSPGGPGEPMDNGIRIKDINNDNYPDILHYKQGSHKEEKWLAVRKSYLNNHSSGWSQTSIWQLPPDVYFGVYKDHKNIIATYLTDVNNDSYPDLINVYKNYQYITPAIYLNNQSNGWVYNGTWKLPSLDYSLDKLHFADVNGDGYDDLWYQGKTYLNNYSGQFNYNSNWDTPFIESYEQPLFTDIDNDNLPEIFNIINSSHGVPDFSITREYYNTGNGWDFTSRQPWELPEYLSDISRGNYNGYRLADVNGDGYTDLMRSREQDTPENRKIWLHDTKNNWIDVSSEWSIPEAFPDDPNDNHVKLTDINGDGLLDILYSRSTLKKVYLGNGQNGWDLSTWNLPVNFTKDKNYGLRIIDINNDRLPDIVYSGKYPSYSTKEAYINNGDGTWSENSNWNIPCSFEADDYTSEQRFGDVNNDGLIDILDTTDRPWKIHINNGQTGWQTDTSWTLPSDVDFGDGEYNPYNYQQQLTDLNEDGYIDIVIKKGGDPEDDKVYINNQKNGWINDTEWQFPFRFAKMGDRFIDANSYGLIDFSHSAYNGQLGFPNQTYIKKFESPDLLVELTSSQGSSSQITYKPSSQYKDESKSEQEVLNKIPFVLQTVHQITTSDGFTTPKTTTYEYADGHYYTDEQFEQTFAGFGKVTKTDHEGNVSKTYYHQGNETDTALGEVEDHIAKRSRPYRQEFYDDTGALEKVTVQKWHNDLRTDGRRFVNLKSKLEVDYAASKAVEARATEYTYDDVGNLDIEENLGEVTLTTNWNYTDTESDKIKRDIDYFSNPDKWIKALPEKEQVYNSTDVLEHKKTYYYDDQAKGSRAVPQKGNLTQLDSELGAKASQISLKLSYDGDYGLVTEEKDPKDNATTITYEQTHKLYPETKTNAEAQTATYTHDLATGQVLTETDPNGNTITKVLDPLGRVKEIKGPNQDGAEVTKQTYTYVDTPLNKSISVKTYFDAANYTETIEYYNGLGQAIQTRTRIKDDGDDDYSVVDFTYDSKGQVTRQSIPYSRTGSARTDADETKPHTDFTYDSLGRKLREVYSSGTVTYTTTFEYDGWTTTITDPEGREKKLYNDAFGNIIQVDENNDKNGDGVQEIYTTEYKYNALQNLISITDNEGNVRNFTYDTLGRRETAEDLHKSDDSTYGVWNYQYDDASNLEKVTDPKGQVIDYTYDSLNRAATENFAGETGAEVTYNYDTATQGVGRLTSIQAPNITISYEYNNQGNIKKETRVIDGETYVTSYTYDWQGNPLTITYPDGFEAKYTYNPVGQLNKIESKEDSGSFTDVITDIDYSPIGQVKFKKYFNGVEETNTYDPDELYRLKTKQSVKASSNLQDLDYTYDNVGNIKQIVDDSATAVARTVNYTYDDLYRLTEANMSGGYTRTYDYDSIGNIENKHGLSFSYNDDYQTNYANPHAVTKIDGQTYTYDQNGNLLSDPEGRIYEYDYQNRLTGLTSTSHDENLAGHWAFDEESGSTAIDSSGKENNGIIHNATYTKGTSGTALDFDGVSGYVRITDDEVIQNIFDEGGSISFWMNADSLGEQNAGRIFSKNEPGNDGFEVFMLDKATQTIKLKFAKRFDVAVGRWVTADSVINLDAWHHVVITYNDSATSNDPLIYIDGESVSLTEDSEPRGTRNDDSGNDLYIGNSIADNVTFDGTIDEFRLYNKILTPGEVNGLLQNPGKDYTTYQYDHQRQRIYKETLNSNKSTIYVNKLYEVEQDGYDQITKRNIYAGSNLVAVDEKTKTVPADLDHDGYFSDINCDDSDPESHPGVIWHLDADDDGYYSEASACTRGPMTSDEDLAGYWTLNEWSGSIAHDTTGHENHGTITSATYVDGISGSALDFDSVSGDAKILDNEAIQNVFDDGGAISVWINADSHGEQNSGRIIDKEIGAIGWNLTVGAETAGKVRLFFTQRFNTTKGQWQTSNTVINLNTWTHVVLTYNNSATGNNPIIYVNGESVPLGKISTPAGTRTSDAGNDLYIGNSSSDNDTFDGSIDDVRLQNDILSPGEIDELYQKSGSWYATGHDLGEDCDDSEPLAHPGLEEIPYDGIDNDCDALTWDDDLDQDGYDHTINCDDSDPLSHPGVIWYFDQDGDDYYSSMSPCQKGEGDPAYWYADSHDLGEDCDDADSAIHPGADDPCDGIDQACDGLGEETDSDGDGYMLCEGDCNDDIITVHPGALEVCQDDIDQDCNGEDLLMCKCPLPEPQVITPFTEWLCPDTSLPQPFVPGELITPDEPLPISERGGFGIASVTNEEIRDQRLDDQDNAPSQSPSEAEGRTKTTYATYYYHTDHLGGTSLVTDENGDVVQILDYFPYGETRIDDQPGGYDSESKYTGQKLDAESGIYYYNARYYNQDIGRFTSIDPLFLVLGTPEAKAMTNKELQELLQDPQGLNSYAYSRNNPVRFIDEEGEWFKEFFTGQQSWPSFQQELGEASQYLYDNSAVSQAAMDHPVAAGAVAGVAGGAVAYGAAAGITYGLTELGLIVPSQADKIDDAVEFTQTKLKQLNQAVSSKEKARAILDSWSPQTFNNISQSIKYHWYKHGKPLGLSLEQYTGQALEFFAKNSDKATNLVDKTSKVANKIYGNPGGLWTETGKIITYWIEKNH